MYTLCKYKRDWKMNWEYLSHQHLVGFEQYQYSSVDTNPISVYIMHPFWERIVLLFPKWVAPNVLTFVGFLCTAGACLLLSIYDYEFYASSSDHPEYSSVPRWIFMAAAVSIFIAYTLDGIDGKQARRTRSSGPLGELFDHGLDSWTAVLIPTCLYSVFGRTDYSVPPVRFYFVCWNVFITFYMSHWEKYNTGVLFLPWGYDLSMLATTGVFVITYLFGHEWWKFKVFEGIATGHILELLFYLSSVVSSLPVVLWNIYKSYQDRTGKMRSFWEANRPLVPLTGFLFICAVWVYYSPSDIISRDPRAFYLTCGTIFSNICIWHRGVEPCGGHCCWMRGGQLDQHGTMTCVFMVVWCWESFSDSPVAPCRYIFFIIGLRCRLIVAQMSNTRCEVYNWLLVPTALCTFLSIYVPSPALEITLLYGLWAFSTLAHIHYGTCVVRQMCSHFNINCFSIKKGTYSE